MIFVLMRRVTSPHFYYVPGRNIQYKLNDRDSFISAQRILTFSPYHWYTSFIYWLINHPDTSYLLYLSPTIFMLFFIMDFLPKGLTWFFSPALFYFCYSIFYLCISLIGRYRHFLLLFFTQSINKLLQML